MCPDCGHMTLLSYDCNRNHLMHVKPLISDLHGVMLIHNTIATITLPFCHHKSYNEFSFPYFPKFPYLPFISI